MSRPHHGPPRRRARVEPERDEVGGAGDDTRAIRMTQRERGDYFGLGARRRLDDAGEVYGIGRGIVSRTDGIDGARARTAAAAYHRDGPFQNLRVDGELGDAVLVGDLNGDGVVNAADLGLLVVAWGPCGKGAPCPADLNEDGIVDAADLGFLFANWS